MNRWMSVLAAAPLVLQVSCARAVAGGGVTRARVDRAVVTAPSGSVSRGDHVRGALDGAVVGGLAGAVIGFALGSLAGGEPTCISTATKCEGHNYSKPGARIGLIIGVPIGAMIGWNRAE